MAGHIFFDNILDLYTKRSTFPTLAMRYVVDHADDHPDIQWLAGEWKKQCGLKMWSLRDFSLEGLRVVQHALEQLNAEFTTALDQHDVPADWRPLFVRHLNDLREMLQVRIERVERHGTTKTDLPALMFSDTLYWEATHAQIDTLLDLLRQRHGADPAFHDIFVARPWRVDSDTDGRSISTVPADGLEKLLRLTDDLERDPAVLLPHWPRTDRDDLARRLPELRRVVRQRLRPRTES